MMSIRLDRRVSLSVVEPVSRLVSRNRRGRVPILMYHSICSTSDKRHPYFCVNTSPEVFARHMDLLREHGYTTVDLTGAILAIGSNAEQRFVAITVDDGYRDFYTHAAPMLAEHGFTATVFVVSDLTGDRTRKCLNGRECMTWREVREVHSCGMSVGSHTASHCQLYGMSLAAIDTELRQSRETLEDRLGEEIGSFAYPYAFPQQDRHFVTVIRHMLSACGYLNGVSTTIGTSSQRNDVYFLPRLPVNSHDDDRLFLAKIYGAYDWLRVPQGLYKHLKQVGRRCYEPTERCRGYVSS